MTHTLRRRFSCPVELAVDVLGGKWKVVILSRLKERSLRYTELRAQLPNLSEKMLVQQLRRLEQVGLIVRHKRGGRGASSRYELTARAESLKPALQALYEWGESIAAEVGATIEPPTATVSKRTSRSQGPLTA